PQKDLREDGTHLTLSIKNPTQSKLSLAAVRTYRTSIKENTTLIDECVDLFWTAKFILSSGSEVSHFPEIQGSEAIPTSTVLVSDSVCIPVTLEPGEEILLAS